MSIVASPIAARRQQPVCDLLAAGELIRSFEFFPPKTAEGEARFWAALHEIARLRPSFVSITYGAGGSSRDRTVDLTDRLVTETDLTVVAHLTAVGQPVSELRQVIGRYADAGVRTILAIRGDPPGDPRAEWVAHPEGVSYAEDLVRLARRCGRFSVGVAAFPERHPRSPDWESEVRYFLRKCRAGADFAITQMFFEVDDYLRLRDRVTAAGCDTPVIPEIMPVTALGQIQRFAELSGATLPPALLARLTAVADDPEAVRRVGVEHAVAMSTRLLAEGAPGLHFITLNNARTVLEIYRMLGW